MREVPQEIRDMLRELEQHQGFRRVREINYGNFGDVRIEVESDNLFIAIVHDRFAWGIEVASKDSPHQSYDVALVVTLLDGVPVDKVTLSDEVQLITKRLNTVTKKFSKEERGFTHACLKDLAAQRWRGRIL